MARLAPLLVSAAVVLLSAGCSSSPDTGGGSDASCVGPYLDHQPPGGPFGGTPPTVAPGTAVTVYGHWYTSTCNDSGADDPLVPLAPLHLTLTLPGGATTDLGGFEPGGEDMGFAATVQIPPGTPTGRATVSDDRPYPATFTFAVGR